MALPPGAVQERSLKVEQILEMIFSEEVLSALLGLGGAVLLFLINRLSAMVETWTGVTIEKKAREDLHEAIMTAVRTAIKHDPNIAFHNLKVEVMDYLHESVPDALATLMPGSGVLDRLIERYAEEVLDRLGARVIDLPQPEPAK